MWFWSEKRLVYIDLGVDVDGVVSDIKKLDDFGLGELFDDVFASGLFLH
jgi:hypothetical protein